jgi:hypothetical protein
LDSLGEFVEARHAPGVAVDSYVAHMTTTASAPQTPDRHEPTHGWTKLGLPVHAKVMDHHPTETAYQRFNKKVALAITTYVGTMTCFWVFCGLALLSLPAVLSGFHVFHNTFPNWMIRLSIIALISWVAQTFLQLVLLPSIMVGQNLQNEASDARSSKTFEDTETIVDRLDTDTKGGIRVLLDKLNEIEAKLPASPSA